MLTRQQRLGARTRVGTQRVVHPSMCARPMALDEGAESDSHRFRRTAASGKIGRGASGSAVLGGSPTRPLTSPVWLYHCRVILAERSCNELHSSCSMLTDHSRACRHARHLGPPPTIFPLATISLSNEIFSPSASRLRGGGMLGHDVSCKSVLPGAAGADCCRGWKERGGGNLIRSRSLPVTAEARKDGKTVEGSAKPPSFTE